MSRAESTDPVARLNDTFAPSVAFGLMAVLNDGADLEVETLRRIFPGDADGLRDAIRRLEAQRFVVVDRRLLRATGGDWVRTTPKGRAAFAAHLAALREIAWADEG
ncbi:transcriptional regulator [Microbacterium sp. K35]|uniref:transcriptional regulator n=1 Tax=Microbacterium sp. K35 TaxID=2305440 RepID=UPI00109BC946|nr:transcriptional regulator [Microbacterium sp. K35]